MRLRPWFVLVGLAGVILVTLTATHDPVGATASPAQVDHTSMAFGPNAQTASVTSTSPELVVAYVAADGDSPNQTVKVSGGGLTWTRVARSNAQLGDAEIWSATTTGTPFSVTAAPRQTGLDTELTVITYKGARGVGASATASAYSGAPAISLTPISSGGIATTVGFDWTNSVDRTLPSDQALLQENTDPAGDTYWVQDAPAPTTAGTKVTLGDLAPTSDQWDLAAVEVTSAASPAPTTTSTPATGRTTTTVTGSTSTGSPSTTHPSTTVPSTTTPSSTTTATTTTTTTTSTATGPLPAGVVLQPIDGGADFYTSHGYTKAAPLDNPNFFPIGIWYPSLNSGSDVDSYKSLDINMLDRPDGNCNLSLLAGTGVYAIPQYGECGGATGSGIGNESVGLFTDDEVDGNYGPGPGYTYLQNLIDNVPSSLKSGRFFWTNYSYNLLLYETTAQASQFINDYQQTVSIDMYWFTSIALHTANNPYDQCNNFYNITGCTDDQAERGSNYGTVIDDERALVSPLGSEPVWSFVEDGCPFTGSDNLCITPAQMNWAVWSSIIHGARGIIYFNHSFSGPSESDNNFEDAYYTTTGITPQAQATNGLITSLAPVLNDDTALNYVTASRAPTSFSGIETMAKYHDGQFTIFADTRDSGSVTDIPATFHVADPSATSVTVVNENRTIPMVNGTFTDTFATGSTVHIYRVNG